MIGYEYFKHQTFFEAFNDYQVKFSEKMVRTYFRQLISGLEYLHNQHIAHLDLKLENIMLNDNFELKIIDFDLACHCKDKGQKIISQGTQNYRAPELRDKRVENYQVCDIYSAGILLFVFACDGILPFIESDDELFGQKLKEYMQNDPSKFWAKHARI